ncbi:MAG: glycosyltransferase, partial [Thaumarchaeota archaeon]|nr:glycosyltransferase [Nitrososphaerota archaeon]
MTESSPLVTIGMPTYNREWSINQVLQSMLQLDYPKSRLRICFVDNESTDATLSILRDFQSAHNEEYERIVIDIARSNISKARNLCFERAKGTDYVFFLDSDILTPPDTLKRLLVHFAEHADLGIASLPWDNKNARKRAGILYDAFLPPEKGEFAYKVGNGCNLISLKVVAKIGYFNEGLRVHEDGEFCYRARRAGFKILCDFSSEGHHLRDIKVDASFYASFIGDSADTYSQLLRDGSGFHYAKYVSSLLLVAFAVVFAIRPSVLSGLIFLFAMVFSMWLNTSRQLLDDGIRVKAAYRPVIGAIFALATVCIVLVS